MGRTIGRRVVVSVWFDFLLVLSFLLLLFYVVGVSLIITAISIMFFLPSKKELSNEYYEKDVMCLITLIAVLLVFVLLIIFR